MSETIEFNGVRFRRYPDAKQRSDRVYFNPGIGDRESGVKRLHEEIWMAAHGPIPSGCHIHHVDGNPLNNALENLEAIPAGDHIRHHRAGVCTDEMRTNLDEIRHLATAWHQSPAGRAWHREHGREVAANLQPVAKICDQCGGDYMVKPLGTSRFCSNACKSAWRRAAGLDNVERECVICGAAFTTNRYSKAKTCSKRCSGRSQSRTKTCSPSEEPRPAGQTTSP